MTNAVEFGGITRVDMEPDKILEAAKGTLDVALVVGLERNGDFWFSSSISDSRELLWLIEQAKHFLLEASRS